MRFSKGLHDISGFMKQVKGFWETIRAGAQKRSKESKREKKSVLIKGLLPGVGFGGRTAGAGEDGIQSL